MMIAAAREYAMKEKVTVTTTLNALDLWFVELTTVLGETEMTAVCSQVKTRYRVKHLLGKSQKVYQS